MNKPSATGTRLTHGLSTHHTVIGLDCLNQIDNLRHRHFASHPGTMLSFFYLRLDKDKTSDYLETLFHHRYQFKP
jgi:hypothetical protein